MSLYDKLNQTMLDRDVTSYMELVHDEAVFIFHKSGSTFSKSEWASMITGMMENEKFIQESSRCIYQNDEILVQHAFMSYPDDTKEAVMIVALLKNGKIICMETGATSLN